MNKIPFIPIDAESWYQFDMLKFYFIGTLLRDFGPWKKNDVVSLTIDLEEGIIIGSLVDGSLRKIIHIELTVKQVEK